MQMNRQISEGKIYNLLRDCRESLIELVEQLQLIKRPGEDYILDKIQNETKLMWEFFCAFSSDARVGGDVSWFTIYDINHKYPDTTTY